MKCQCCDSDAVYLSGEISVCFECGNVVRYDLNECEEVKRYQAKSE